ncbi:MAG: hypothetical protein AABZ55_06700, partial [Bdellovibrionota bacterium]
ILLKTSDNDTSVSISADQDSVVFPDGSSSGQITISRISANYSTIPTPEYAQPDTILALEPSGLTFKSRAKLVLPNENDLPPGVTLMILSMNSKKGIWEIDGIADVSSDGQSVVTRPGFGISHYSSIFAAPLGPKVKALGGQDRPGANTFTGEMAATIKLP